MKAGLKARIINIKKSLFYTLAENMRIKDTKCASNNA